MGLEDRVQNADERLTTTRRDLRELSGIGMSPEYLSAFTQRLKVIAQRHGMKPEVVCRKLMDELEQLGEGFGMDTITKAKKQELRRIETTLLKAKDESVGIGSANEKLRQERSGLRAALLEERRHITKDFEAINLSAIRSFAELNQKLRSGVGKSVSEVNRLGDRALELGKEMGHYNEIIESNKWLKGLQTLVKGDEEVAPSQVRVIGITLMQAVLTWLDRHPQDSSALWPLRPAVTNLIGELERWKPQPLLKD